MGPHLQLLLFLQVRPSQDLHKQAHLQAHPVVPLGPQKDVPPGGRGEATVPITTPEQVAYWVCSDDDHSNDHNDAFSVINLRSNQAVN